MKAKIKKLLGSLLLASSASLLHAAGVREAKPAAPLPNDEEALKTLLAPRDFAGKGLFVASERLAALAGRTSHTSHASHRSSSPATRGGKKKSAAEGDSLSRVSTSKPRHKVRTRLVSAEERRFSLGDRVLVKGDVGSDVRDLGVLLKKLGFLDDAKIFYEEGYPVYDAVFIRAVKAFQQASGLPVDGVCGKTTLQAISRNVARLPHDEAVDSIENREGGAP